MEIYRLTAKRLTRREFLRALGIGMISPALFSLPKTGRQRPGKIQVESFDSGTRVIREVAEALTGRGRSILECYPLGSELFLWFLSLLPENLRIGGIEWGISLGVGNLAKNLEDFGVDSLYRWCIKQYPASKYEVIVVGSPNGGIAHLAALLRAPFLTTSFELSFRHPPFNPDDLQAYFKTGKNLAETILNKSENIEVISHYDPLHDRNLVKYVNRLRIKLLKLPSLYKEFIFRNLASRGKLILINCSYHWPQYKLGKRSFLQIGGLGGISPEEYLKRWSLNLPLDERRESEWGCPEEFASSVREFAQRHGIELLEVSFDHPQKYSLLAYKGYLKCKNARKETIFFDCFNHQNPRTNIQTGIPGLWLPFNTKDSLEFAEEFLKEKKFEKIYLTLLPSFTKSPDTPPLDCWIEIMKRYGKLKLLGISPHLFPADPLAPFLLVSKMRKIRQKYKLSDPLYLSFSEFGQLLA